MRQRLLCLSLLTWLAVPCFAQGIGRGPAGNEELSNVLAGIVHYTRWPDAPATLHLCVDVGDELATGAGARRLADLLAALDPRPVSIDPRHLDDGPAAVADCQVVYMGTAAAASWQRLLKDLANRPVLAIGYGEDFCSRGGQFCLEAASLRMHANLDAIALSKLRVNPQLLRFTQRDPKGGR
jgi:hypothetical protein